MITLDALHLLDAIDRHGTFAAAATALHRVPSAVTHAVQRLEDDLGVALFSKTGRRASLTPAGRTLLEEGRPLLRAAADLERRVQRVASGWEKELRIAVEAVIPTERLFPILERFYAEGHTTQLSLSSEVLGGGWDALVTQRADLAIGVPGDPPPHSGLSASSLGESWMVFAVAPQHPLAAYPGPIPAAELVRHRAVVLPDTSQELKKRTSGLLEGQPALRVPDFASKAAAQAAGLGVGHLPRWLAEQEAAAGRLVIRELEEQRPTGRRSIAWRTRHDGKALAWFLAALGAPEYREALFADL